MMWKIRYCGSWNYKPQAESLSAEMEKSGFTVIIEEGDTGQFELFKKVENHWVSFMKGGQGEFFTLKDFEEKLGKTVQD